MWLTGRLAPDFKTIADFRRHNGTAICAACARFIVICRNIGLFTLPLGSAKAKEALGSETIEAIADAGYYRGPDLLACRDIGITALAPRTNTSNAKAEGRFSKEAFVYLSDQDAYRCPAGEFPTHRYDTREGDLTMGVDWCTACPACPMKDQCTTGKERRVKCWEHQNIVEAMTARMQAIGAMAIRRETVRHPFSTIKAWIGATHFLCKPCAPK